LNRSRRKKYDKEKQGRTGLKTKRGSHLDASPARQCPRCDKGLHRRCERLAHCTARQRSPAGVSKRKEGENSARASRRRARICDILSECASTTFSPLAFPSPLRVIVAADRLAQQAEKKAKKALAFGPQPKPENQWVAIEGLWLAYAVDGKGHHDGDGKYVCQIPVKDFGEHFFLGGEARITLGSQQVFRLPSVAPPPAAGVTFRLQVEQRVFGGMGRLALVDGIEVRAPSQ
jgi:hypothetical protein